MVAITITVAAPARLENPDMTAFDRAGHKAAAVLMRGIEETFVEEGPGWAPLAPSTLAARRRKLLGTTKKKKRRALASGIGLGGTKKLQDTGTLHVSLVSETAPGHYQKLERFRIEVGTRIKYGIFHQKGTRKMPAREFLKERPQDVAAIKKIYAQAFKESVTGK